MKKLLIFLSAGLFLAFWGTSVMATPVLYEWAFNLNGDIYSDENSSTVTELDDSGFDYDTGLGTLNIEYRPVAGCANLKLTSKHSLC